MELIPFTIFCAGRELIPHTTRAFPRFAHNSAASFSITGALTDEDPADFIPAFDAIELCKAII